MSTNELTFSSFKEFYPYYLGEHSNRVCRICHFLGTSLLFVLIVFSTYTGNYKLLWALPVVGYGFAWLGHFVFEKNRPATFKFPFYSLTGDFMMYFDILRGKVKIF